MVNNWDELFLRIVLATLFTVAPLSVKVPSALALVELFPIKNAAARAEVTSTAPTAWFLEPLLVVPFIFIPAPPVPVGLAPNWAIWELVGTAPPVQLLPDSQAEPPDDDQSICPCIGERTTVAVTTTPKTRSEKPEKSREVEVRIISRVVFINETLGVQSKNPPAPQRDRY